MDGTDFFESLDLASSMDELIATLETEKDSETSLEETDFREESDYYGKYV